jgi:hypothetical protein
LEEKLGWERALAPGVVTGDAALRSIASSPNVDRVIQAYPRDISAPSDDRPYFFNTYRPGDYLDPGQPVFVLTTVFLALSALTLFLILLPLWLRGRVEGERLPWDLTTYFGAIGMAFMFLEIALIQRLIVFLGHPTYALSVLLSVVLVTAGLGSLHVHRQSSLDRGRFISFVRIRLPALILVSIAAAVGTPLVAGGFAWLPDYGRILLSVTLLAPLGYLMGMPLPIGMRIVAADHTSVSLMPWYWGLNGAASVLAAVLAVLVSLIGGISATHWTGCFFYAVAATAAVSACRKYIACGSVME